jgi:hypothetical protein
MDEAERQQRESTITEEYGRIYPIYEAFYIHSIIYAAIVPRMPFSVSTSPCSRKKFEFRPVRSEVQRILAAAAEMLSQGFAPGYKG